MARDSACGFLLMRDAQGIYSHKNLDCLANLATTIPVSDSLRSFRQRLRRCYALP
jgi:hypothetical protein